VARRLPRTQRMTISLSAADARRNRVQRGKIVDFIDWGNWIEAPTREWGERVAESLAELVKRTAGTTRTRWPVRTGASARSLSGDFRWIPYRGQGGGIIALKSTSEYAKAVERGAYYEDRGWKREPVWAARKLWRYAIRNRARADAQGRMLKQIERAQRREARRARRA